MRIIQVLMIIIILSLISIGVFLTIQKPPDVIVQAPQTRALSETQIANIMHNIKCCGFENVTAADTAKTLNATFLSHSSCGTAIAIRLASDDLLRFRVDGNAPTTSTGEVWGDSDATGRPLWLYWDDNLSNFQYIRSAAGTTANMAIHYYYVR
jgi:hypothetical protein